MLQNELDSVSMLYSIMYRKCNYYIKYWKHNTVKYVESMPDDVTD